MCNTDTVAWWHGYRPPATGHRPPATGHRNPLILPLQLAGIVCLSQQRDRDTARHLQGIGPMRTHDAFPDRHNWHTLARSVADIASSYHMASESAYSESLGNAFLVPVTLPLVCELAANDNVDALTLVEYVLREMPTHVIARCFDNGQCDLWLYDTLSDAMVDWRNTALELNGGYDVTFRYTVPSSEYTASYDYNSKLSYGTLTSSLGNTIVLQGDDASTLHDTLELLPTDDLVLLELSAYDTLWGDNG